MQALEILAVVTAVVAVIVFLVVRVGDREAPRSRLAQVAIGIVPGVLGALLILTRTTDLVPDDYESVIRPAVVIFVSVVAIGGVWYQLARR